MRSNANRNDPQFNKRLRNRKNLFPRNFLWWACQTTKCQELEKMGEKKKFREGYPSMLHNMQIIVKGSSK